MILRMTLVFQSLLPPLMLGSQSSRLRFRGGTHNLMAPPFDFLSSAYLPQVGQLGPVVSCELLRYGFYPRGGGEFSATIRPAARLAALELLERGKLIRRQVTAIVSQLPVSIAQREVNRIQAKSGWPKKCFRIIEVSEPAGPGNVVLIEVVYQNVTEVFTGFGQRGVPAEKVADSAWRELQRYLKSDAPVGEHLADQLLLPLAIGAYFGSGGGQFRTTPLSRHSTTQLELLPMFLNVDIDLLDAGGDVVLSIQPVDS